MENEIEKPWAVYGNYTGSLGIQRIVAKSQNSVQLQKYEEQKDFFMSWDSRFVNRFETPVQAMKYYLKNRRVTDDPLTPKEEIEKFLNSFPSEAPRLIFS